MEAKGAAVDTAEAALAAPQPCRGLLPAAGGEGEGKGGARNDIRLYTHTHTYLKYATRLSTLLDGVVFLFLPRGLLDVLPALLFILTY